ncbi:hypothetical protein L1887_13728 [Cichorium endivia]|nr:hypothetical protein L1887_13728 [Cichorium endivia]
MSCALVSYMCYSRRLRKSGRISNQQSIPRFSFRQIAKATNNFDEARVIGEGGFGKVYLGTCNEGNNVAVKGETSPDCLKIYVESAVNCLASEGKDRPSMGDVFASLERALKLQESDGVFLKMPPDGFVEWQVGDLRRGAERIELASLCARIEKSNLNSVLDRWIWKPNPAYLGFGVCFAINVIFGPYSHSDDWRRGCGSVAAVFKRDTRWRVQANCNFDAWKLVAIF